ncbi:terpene synthase family protein [Kitasatospora sp. NBC_01539]|uniref:terpene synthase family protein n=1 Tax=Kitasatospora sp. NBC_01539 TaxID=2903577 RepID=UPI0038600A84
MQSYTIPRLRTGVPWQINPHHTPGLDAEANAWAFGLFSDDKRVPVPVRADNYTTWAALCFPDVGTELLTLWCRFNALYTVAENRQEVLFSTADAGGAEAVWGRMAQCLLRLSHAPDPEEVPPDGWGDGLPRFYLHAARNIALTMAPAQGRYFLRRTAQMAMAQFQEKDAIASPRMGLEEYVEYRQTNFGVPLFVAAVPSMLSAPLATEWWDSTERRELDRLTARHCCLVNDLYSFRKEHEHRDGKPAPVQAVTVLKSLHDLSLQGAVDRLVEVIEETEAEFREARKRAAVRPERAEYADRLGHILAGNLRYHLISPRFHGQSFEGVFSGGEVTLSGRPVWRT